MRVSITQMLFNSVQYIIFLPIVVACYWLLPKRVRPYLLLIASYYFYMSWMASYGLLLFGMTAFNYVFGLLLGNQKIAQHYRRIILIAGLAGNLGALCLFKYTNFLVDAVWQSTRELATLFHAGLPLAADSPVFNILLPLGISFFVFEFIHYITDVYKGSAPLKNPVQFALFAAFFPSQIAGPIKRFQDFRDQLNLENVFNSTVFRAGLTLIFVGMFKKVVLGDNLALIVQPGFEAASKGTLFAGDAWIAAIAFYAQIYFDFSGYTDIGRGSAMLMGFKLPDNFNKPYLSTSVQDFWRRWHMSLGSWLRDYLYIPMGGSKAGYAKQMRNLFLTMALAGLWHGAAWHFVWFGIFHGLGLCVNHTWSQWAAKYEGLTRFRQSQLGTGIALVGMLVYTVFGFAVFRADTMTEFVSLVATMFGLTHAPALTPLSADTVSTVLIHSTIPVGFVLFGIYNLLDYLSSKVKDTEQSDNRIASVRWWFTPPLAAQTIAALALCFLIVGFAPKTAIPFIYFRF